MEVIFPQYNPVSSLSPGPRNVELQAFMWGQLWYFMHCWHHRSDQQVFMWRQLWYTVVLCWQNRKYGVMCRITIMVLSFKGTMRCYIAVVIQRIKIDSLELGLRLTHLASVWSLSLHENVNTWPPYFRMDIDSLKRIMRRRTKMSL